MPRICWLMGAGFSLESPDRSCTPELRSDGRKSFDVAGNPDLLQPGRPAVNNGDRGFWNREGVCEEHQECGVGPTVCGHRADADDSDLTPIG